MVCGRILRLASLLVVLSSSQLPAQWDFKAVELGGWSSRVYRFSSSQIGATLGSDDCLYTTTDGGETWKKSWVPSTTQGNAAIDFAVYAGDHYVVVARREVSFGRVGAGSEYTYSAGDASLGECRRGLFGSLAVSRAGTVWIVTSEGILMSQDNGATIECVHVFTDTPPLGRISFNDEGVGLGLAVNGLHRSTDYGVSWTHQQVSLSDAYDVAVGPSGSGVVVGRQIWHSEGGGDSWSVAEHPIIQACSAAVYLDSNRVMAAGDGNIVCSSDGGKSWSYGKRETEEPLRAYSVSAPSPTFLVVGSRDGYLFSETGCMPTTSAGRDVEAPEGYTGALRLSPNPARDVLRIEARHEIEKVSVHVLSSGKSILSTDDSIVPSNVVSMDVGSLPSGAYVVVALTKDRILRQYFVK